MYGRVRRNYLRSILEEPYMIHFGGDELSDAIPEISSWENALDTEEEGSDDLEAPCHEDLLDLYLSK